MAVSGKTTKLAMPYFEEADAPPNMSTVTKAMADRAEALLTGTKGQLLIVQNTGAPAATALKGDATLAEDGTLTVADRAITSRKFRPSTGLLELSADTAMGEVYADLPGLKLEITPEVASI